ncbi:UvrD-helicase domain-containing protein [Desulfurispira natronophila]|uniref:DNA 3'-5' helicase n=1 Tax=Desulfurispira natronophila TaxID=682562 RepID=A0A7W7Y3X2_9BACT|nr:ATP-dependent exoDNAse (exonuclease V) beta subunit [Desulfurispira natronophila]
MKNIELINASAGSGKTFTLTRHMQSAISKGLDPAGLMATTFTNKAAAELRERIRMQLLQQGNHAAAQAVLDGFIGTVNSICARLLTEYAIDAGLSPALDVMPEEESSRLFNIAVSAVMDAHADNIEPLARRLLYDGSGSGYQKNSDWRSVVHQIVDRARTNQIDRTTLDVSAQRSSAGMLALLDAPLSSVQTQKLTGLLQKTQRSLLGSQIADKTTQGSLDTINGLLRKLQLGEELYWGEWLKIMNLKSTKASAQILEPLQNAGAEVMACPEFHQDVQQFIQHIFACAAEGLEAYDRFKRKQGLMDFVDQEARVLVLCRSNQAFRDSMRQRLQMLMVDEFQDTSPIQLALFLELHALAGDSVWVGDPKQAIYGFRGTDPQLMEAVTNSIQNTSTLGYSWRSTRELVKFSNAVFAETFHELGRDKVCLQIPKARAKSARGGWLEAWHLLGKNKDSDTQGIAMGIAQLLKENPRILPSHIAVLCRTNYSCTSLASSLKSLGIKASVAEGSLLQTRECQLALAALRCMNDHYDTIALAELVHLHPHHQDHGQWLASVVNDPEVTREQWASDPMVQQLRAARQHISQWTPLEALERAMDAIDLPRIAGTWSNAPVRMGNLDQLRAHCVLYVDQCQARRSAATVAGFISHISSSDGAQAEGRDENTVQVLTYHRSKGLEWPVVILTDLGNEPKTHLFGTRVMPPSKFKKSKPLDSLLPPEGSTTVDLSDPLKGRWINFWPWPFGNQRKSPLDDVLDERLPDRKRLEKQDFDELLRLLYVGMTRARTGMVLVVRKQENKNSTKLVTKWLDLLCDHEGKGVLTLPMKSGKQQITVGKEKIDIQVRQFDASTMEEGEAPPQQQAYVAPVVSEVAQHRPARILASSLSSTEETTGDMQVVAQFDNSIEITGSPQFSSLGSAIHGYFGVDTSNMEESRKRVLATQLLQRFGVAQHIKAESVLNAASCLEQFISTHHPAAIIRREWPIFLRNEHHQTMQGWIDMLLELPEGYVIIDHKSYPGHQTTEKAREFAPQLQAYAEAVTKATGKPVLSTLLHLPVSGCVVRVCAK